MTKQCFAQFKGGFENTDIRHQFCPLRPRLGSTGYKSAQCRLRGHQIVVEFARCYTHLSRPKPSVNPDILLEALEDKRLSDKDSRQPET
jgi:hypothetical protein